MGHRASVAYVRDDDTVQAHYSHWGALDARMAFGTVIDRDRPYGAPTGETPEEARQGLLRALQSEQDCQEVFDGAAERERNHGDLSAEPYDSFPDVESWAADGINFLHHEAAYLVDPRGVSSGTWPVRAFDTMWYQGTGSSPDEWKDSGILVELQSADEWGTFAHGTEDDPSPDSSTERHEWVNNALEWLGADTQRIPSFSPLPRDNRA